MSSYIGYCSIRNAKILIYKCTGTPNQWNKMDKSISTKQTQLEIGKGVFKIFDSDMDLVLECY